MDCAIFFRDYDYGDQHEKLYKTCTYSKCRQLAKLDQKCNNLVSVANQFIQVYNNYRDNAIYNSELTDCIRMKEINSFSDIVTIFKLICHDWVSPKFKAFVTHIFYSHCYDHKFKEAAKLDIQLLNTVEMKRVFVLEKYEIARKEQNAKAIIDIFELPEFQCLRLTDLRDIKCNCLQRAANDQFAKDLFSLHAHEIFERAVNL